MRDGKYVKSYFEVRTISESEINLGAIKAYFNKNFTNIGKFSEDNLAVCLETIENYINLSLEDELDDLKNNFILIDKFLNRCFSIFLSLDGRSNESITYEQLLELGNMIEFKDAVPYGFKTSMTILELKKELSCVKLKIKGLPNLTKPAQVIRLFLFLK